jgi:hypothetical protein
VFHLGQKVRCRITGIDYIVIGLANYLYRSPQLQVAREGVDHDGSPWPELWIDLEQVEAAPDA